MSEQTIIALRMRKEGFTFAEIAEQLNIPKSTVYGWANGIRLTDVQRKKILDRQYAAKLLHIRRLAELRKLKTQKNNEILSQSAKSLISKGLFNRDQSKILCALLLWCEGEKTEDSVVFINSDPRLVTTFLRLLRESFDLDESKFRALIHLHDYHIADIQTKFWSDLTKIPTKQFYRPYRKPHTGKRVHDNYPGCISIRYYDASLGKLLKMIYTQFSSQI